MKLSTFSTLPGATDIDKCQALLDRAPDSKVYIQTKANGVSAEIYRDYLGAVVFKTRNNKLWPSGFFPTPFYTESAQLLKNLPQNVSLFAELHVPGEQLATVAGWVNVNSPRAHEEFCRRARLTVWDCSLTGVPFSLRMQYLRHAQQHFASFLEVAHTSEVNSATAMEGIYNAVVNEKEEGVVYRVDPCLYFPGDAVSPHAYKRTQTHTEEAVCVSVSEGEGKRKGMLGAMYLKYGDQVLALGGGAGMDDELLTKLYQQPPIGKLVTFSYKEKSINGMPLRAQFVAIRDYE